MIYKIKAAAAFFLICAAAALCSLGIGDALAAGESDLAQEYMQKQEYSSAAELYSKLLAQDEYNVHLMFNLGTSLSFLNEQTRAVEVLEKCSLAIEKKLESGHDTTEAELLAHVYNNLSKCYMSLGRHDDAAEACRRGIKSSSGLSWLHFNLGDALLAKGEAKSALACFRRALELDPNDMAANLKIVECNYALQDYNEAGRLLTELAKLYPENSEILFNLGSVYYKQDRADEAIKLWKAIAEREPDSKFGQISRKWLSELNVNVNSGARLLEETVECDIFGFSFLKPRNFYIAKAGGDASSYLYMMSSHIYDEDSKNTAEISLSISAQVLSEPQDHRQFGRNWQKNQAGSGQNFELIAEKETPAGRNEKPGLMWEYSARYNDVPIKGATLAFINGNYAVLIWLNATPATFARAVESFHQLARSFGDSEAPPARKK